MTANQDIVESTDKSKGYVSWLFGLLSNWTASSPSMLRNVEKKLLSFLKSPYRGFYVDIGPAVGEADKIWTIGLNTESTEIPLVMLHGLGAGVALWILNLDSLSTNRPVYALDVLGFGRSSRPKFAKDALVCEKQFVKSIEEWRREMNIKQMILLGHSLGGFLASSYALSFPDRVKHLILADPWGFPEKPSETSNKSLPLWVRAIAYAFSPFNPLWLLRFAGKFGPLIVEKTRPDITRKFSTFIKEENSSLIPQYIHQCNAQSPSGESAFHNMMEGFGYALNPMIKRLTSKEVLKDIPITFIYGSRSWIDSSSGEKIQSARADSSVSIRIISGAGHHVYADKADVFNKYVNEACSNNMLKPLEIPESTSIETQNFTRKNEDVEEDQEKKDEDESNQSMK